MHLCDVLQLVLHDKLQETDTLEVMNAQFAKMEQVIITLLLELLLQMPCNLCPALTCLSKFAERRAESIADTHAILLVIILFPGICIEGACTCLLRECTKHHTPDIEGRRSSSPLNK